MKIAIMGYGTIGSGVAEVLEVNKELIEARAGERVFHSLLSADPPEQIRLEVASTNDRAIRFYEKMGLVKTAEIRRWYRVH